MSANPTLRTYDRLNQAYEYLSATLFEGELPPCLITMQRLNVWAKPNASLLCAECHRKLEAQPGKGEKGG